MSEMVEVGPPQGPVFRVARIGHRPFASPVWDHAHDDGTFGNRFDDPNEKHGLPPQQRFRTIYCATQKSGAFGETLARYRRSISLNTKLQNLAEAEGDGPGRVTDDLNDVLDPEYPDRGLVPISWRLDRHIGRATLDPSLRFVDIANAQTLNHLRKELATVAQDLALTDVDLSVVTGPQRKFTQVCARYIYESGFAGVRYLSRLNPEWECWAIFDHRVSFLFLSSSPDFSHFVIQTPGLVGDAALADKSVVTHERLGL